MGKTGNSLCSGTRGPDLSRLRGKSAQPASRSALLHSQPRSAEIERVIAALEASDHPLGTLIGTKYFQQFEVPDDLQQLVVYLSSGLKDGPVEQRRQWLIDVVESLDPVPKYAGPILAEFYSYAFLLFGREIGPIWPQASRLLNDIGQTMADDGALDSGWYDLLSGATNDLWLGKVDDLVDNEQKIAILQALGFGKKFLADLRPEVNEALVKAGRQFPGLDREIAAGLVAAIKVRKEVN